MCKTKDIYIGTSGELSCRCLRKDDRTCTHQFCLTQVEVKTHNRINNNEMYFPEAWVKNWDGYREGSGSESHPNEDKECKKERKNIYLEKKMRNLSMFHHIFMHQHRRHEIEPTICSFRNLKAQYSNLVSERKKDSFEF